MKRRIWRLLPADPIAPSLRGSPAGVRPVGPLHDAGVEPLGDQAEQPPVPDPVLEEADQMAPPEIVEESADIGIHNPVDLTPFHSDRDGIERPAPRRYGADTVRYA